jgi:hypothetical protein
LGTSGGNGRARRISSTNGGRLADMASEELVVCCEIVVREAAVEEQLMKD